MSNLNTPASPALRFLRRMRVENGCWMWNGYVNAQGYGKLGLPNPLGYKSHYAHRWAYAEVRGEIPKGMTLDHLCKNTACANPWHMEVVSRAENSMRGNSPAAQNARKDKCSRGHSNWGTWAKDGTRYCRDCNASNQRIYRTKRQQRALDMTEHGWRLEL
jgi:hypothetical protein